MKFFGSWAKLELHIVVRSWVSLGNTTFMGGLWSNGINFDDVHCYEILTRALVAMDPKKSPREPHFWWIFLDFILWNFLWGTIPFLWYLLSKSTESAFFCDFSKKNRKISHFGWFHLIIMSILGTLLLQNFTRMLKNYSGKGLTTNKVSTGSLSLYGWPKITQFHLKMHIYG